MKAPDFAYARPDTVEAALRLLEGAGEGREAMLLAGGQSLMPMVNLRLAAPDILIDLNRIGALQGIAETDEALRIGAMTRYAALLSDERIAAHAPLLAKALPHVAHAAIRNRGTVGGSVALADPAAELPAVLLALMGTVELTGPSGVRLVPAEDYFVGLYETARRPNEMVTAILLPKSVEGERTGFHELSRRHGDYAVAGAAVAVPAPERQAPRIALFAVSHKPVRADAAEAALARRDPSDPAAWDAAVEALEEVEFAGDLHAGEATKRHLAGVALKRALAQCWP